MSQGSIIATCFYVYTNVPNYKININTKLVKIILGALGSVQKILRHSIRTTWGHKATIQSELQTVYTQINDCRIPHHPKAPGVRPKIPESLKRPPLFPLLEFSPAHSSQKAYPVLATMSPSLPLFVTKALPTIYSTPLVLLCKDNPSMSPSQIGCRCGVFTGKAVAVGLKLPLTVWLRNEADKNYFLLLSVVEKVQAGQWCWGGGCKVGFEGSSGHWRCGWTRVYQRVLQGARLDLAAQPRGVQGLHSGGLEGAGVLGNVGSREEYWGRSGGCGIFGESTGICCTSYLIIYIEKNKSVEKKSVKQIKTSLKAEYSESLSGLQQQRELKMCLLKECGRSRLVLVLVCYSETKDYLNTMEKNSVSPTDAVSPPWSCPPAFPETCKYRSTPRGVSSVYKSLVLQKLLSYNLVLWINMTTKEVNATLLSHQILHWEYKALVNLFRTKYLLFRGFGRGDTNMLGFRNPDVMVLQKLLYEEYGKAYQGKFKGSDQYSRKGEIKKGGVCTTLKGGGQYSLTKEGLLLYSRGGPFKEPLIVVHLVYFYSFYVPMTSCCIQSIIYNLTHHTNTKFVYLL
ncbi:hypothetical protein VP01_1748g3 [Puccinia sorghi]|uniref:Uncharacterized protein n=1 Tax=Puccinia sorghi TaxID=27349 RepID=A0A0L6VGZ7_9BASI|nr:hypothetical protein VP01_1748g3 [Puccinia sorghi]